MSIPVDTLRTLHLLETPRLALDLQAFLLDARARNLAPGSLRFYEQKLRPLVSYLRELGVLSSEEVTSGHLRRWLVTLQETDHNPGGVHGFYRAAKAFFTWLLAEEMIVSNPMARIKAPKVPEEQLEPVTVEQVKALLDVCEPKTVFGIRDRAILLCLWDTGCRASEFVALNYEDVDLSTGSVLVRLGKGRKARVTFLGVRSRRELLRYLHHRGELPLTAPLFVGKMGKRLAYSGLRDILRRRAEDAGIPAPALHAFRRGFALDSLRNGADVYSLQKMMGHTSLVVLRRYLRQTQDDLRKVHEETGSVDSLKRSE